MDKTKEKILQIARTWAGLDEKAFIALVKEKKIDGKFNPANWDKYMAAIKSIAMRPTKEPRCEICQAPMRRRHQGGSFPQQWTCSAVATHTFVCRTANLAQAFNPGLDRETALKWATGKNCKHKIPLSECRECGMVAMQANIKKNSPIKEEEI